MGRPRARAHSSEASSTAAAPSVRGVLLPAVMVPPLPGSNTGFSLPSFSRVVSRRRLLSSLTPCQGITRSR